MTSIDTLIDRLAEDSRPVRPRSVAKAASGLGAVALMTLVAVAALLGLRSDVASLAPQPLIVISSGLIVIVAAAAGFGAVRSARPQVGAPPSGARWALAALLVLPLAALIGVAVEPSQTFGLDPVAGVFCLTLGVVAGLATLTFLTLWQRGGAPVKPERAAWLAGLASGAVGALAVTIECPIDSFAHIGVWHVAAVPLSGLAARLLLPPLLRW